MIHCATWPVMYLQMSLLGVGMIVPICLRIYVVLSSNTVAAVNSTWLHLEGYTLYWIEIFIVRSHCIAKVPPTHMAAKTWVYTNAKATTTGRGWALPATCNAMRVHSRKRNGLTLSMNGTFTHTVLISMRRVYANRHKQKAGEPVITLQSKRKHLQGLQREISNVSNICLHVGSKRPSLGRQSGKSDRSSRVITTATAAYVLGPTD
jgi:hypothetical protein